MYHLDDTIVAIASAPAAGPRGLVRVSGSRAPELAARCFQSVDSSPSEARRPQVFRGSVLIDPPLGSPAPLKLPAMLYYWPSSRSYTREPLAELHTVGSPPLLAALVRTLCASGARLAREGEFTLRAFLAGRIDLTQAEAVLGVIDAPGREELEVSLAQLAGGVARPLRALREELVDLLAEIEAGLDFVEEEIEFVTSGAVRRRLTAAATEVAALERRMSERHVAGDLPRVVLSGSPNAGKSSLFNVLAPGGRALVSPRPGTTRDYLTARLDLGGLECELIDTAGCEEIGTTDAPRDEIAAAAQAARQDQLARADLVLYCLDSSSEMEPRDRSKHSVGGSWRARRQILRDSPPFKRRARLKHSAALPSLARIGPEAMIVLTKCDQPRRLDAGLTGIETSVVAGQGIEALRAALRDRLANLDRGGGSVVGLTAARCGESLREAAAALARAIEAQENSRGEEIVAGEIRLAAQEIGKVAGTVYTDDILDRVFSRFCIGK